MIFNRAGKEYILGQMDFNPYHISSYRNSFLKEDLYFSAVFNFKFIWFSPIVHYCKEKKNPQAQINIYTKGISQPCIIGEDLCSTVNFTLKITRKKKLCQKVYVFHQSMQKL